MKIAIVDIPHAPATHLLRQTLPLPKIAALLCDRTASPEEIKANLAGIHITRAQLVPLRRELARRRYGSAALHEAVQQHREEQAFKRSYGSVASSFTSKKTLI